MRQDARHAAALLELPPASCRSWGSRWAALVTGTQSSFLLCDRQQEPTRIIGGLRTSEIGKQRQAVIDDVNQEVSWRHGWLLTQTMRAACRLAQSASVRSVASRASCTCVANSARFWMVRLPLAGGCGGTVRVPQASIASAGGAGGWHAQQDDSNSMASHFTVCAAPGRRVDTCCGLHRQPVLPYAMRCRCAH